MAESANTARDRHIAAEPSPSLPDLRPQVATTAKVGQARPESDRVFSVEDVTISYADVPAIRDVRVDIHSREITAFIGPSGCGKSTLLRAFNRTNDLIPSASMTGTITYHGHDLYAPEVDPVEVRRRIGMVFQKPNPFPRAVLGARPTSCSPTPRTSAPRTTSPAASASASVLTGSSRPSGVEGDWNGRCEDDALW